MSNFLKEKLQIDFYGDWQVEEIAAAAIILIVVVLIVWAVVKLAKKIKRDLNPRKSTIFSHRKNKYKNRIGKKNKY